jgi:LEA14-like dessication related protein
MVLVGSCTPLGLWIYEDPVVTVSRVTLQLREPREVGGSPVVVALDVHNRNDYPLSTTGMEVSLRLDGVAIGSVSQDGTLAVATDTVSTVALALKLEKHATTSRLRALDAGSHRFAVRGRATFKTPIGTRRVRFAEEGEMVFGRRAVSLSRAPRCLPQEDVACHASP